LQRSAAQVFFIDEPFGFSRFFLSRFFNAKIELPILPLHNRLKNFENSSSRGFRFFKCFDFFKCRWRSALPFGPPHAPKEAVAPSRDEAAQARLLDARRVLRVRER
jgi:hypothetical protein